MLALALLQPAPTEFVELDIIALDRQNQPSTDLTQNDFEVRDGEARVTIRSFQAVTARGVEIIMVFSRGELGLKLLELQAGDILRSLSERGRLHIVDGVDHMFTGDAARRALQMLLSQSFAMAEPPGARADAHRAAAGARETPDTAADTWRSAARCRASN